MNNLNKRRIYIDLDGVLVNLEEKLEELFGKDFKTVSADKMWGTIRDEELNFFLKLRPYNLAYKFVEDIYEKYSDSYYISILTALPWPTGNLITAAKDKEKWVRIYIHDTMPVHTIIGGVNKPEYINNPGDILIDDTPKVLDRWVQKGGVGILHTSYENSLNELKILCSK
jgi:phosphoglycolate phosphatase-like HAD superfamily hydrolase